MYTLCKNSKKQKYILCKNIRISEKLHIVQKYGEASREIHMCKNIKEANQENYMLCKNITVAI